MHDDALAWWIAAAALVALELGSGSFYLLMLAVGAAAAALAAHLGAALALQAAVAATVGAGLVSLLGWRKRAAADAGRNRDVLLDIGAQIGVDAWSADGRARVRWRGADWDARCTDAQPPHPGPHTIVGLDGNCLLLHALSAPATPTE